MKSSHIRSAFIDFFKKKQHQHVPGAPIIPDNDPSLLFINAGMNQFKDVFLGTGSRDYSRAVNSQFCIRVSGKHNDLEDVGHDLTHLTSFEMLGNWSFGDYYKEDAIAWAWELLTSEFKISKDNLVATVFEEDQESRAIWEEKTDIDPAQIVSCDAKDNFWEMGATGPCGPCSELHIYIKDGPLPKELNQDVLNNGDFIELWNLVFIQYNREASGDLTPLPQKHVDTGAGLERLTAYLQGQTSTYQTDLFLPIIKHIEELSGQSYSDDAAGVPHRVLADHVRTLSIGIADNVQLSNEGRGYVLRRLLRRACRYAKLLGFTEPVLYKLVPYAIDALGADYDAYKQREAHIQTVIQAEERQFLITLSKGLQVFDAIVGTLDIQANPMVPGPEAFKLYDTYGFPLDLTQVLAKEQNIDVDVDGFHVCLDEQRQRSRNASQFTQQEAHVDKEITPEHFKGLPVHLAEDLNVAKGGEARIIASPDEKLAMAQHHSATHLLHESLRRRLGEHVQQAGSLVDNDRLRFDFTHHEKLTPACLEEVEQDIYTWITKNMPVQISFSTLDEAKAQGVMALFGEKYDHSRVRVVDIGGESVELCAGTHVQKTGQIEGVKLISETSISAGTRRIEAIAGEARIKAYYDNILSEFQNKIAALLKKNASSLNELENNTELAAIVSEAQDITQQSLENQNIEDKKKLREKFENHHLALLKAVKSLQKKQKKQQQTSAGEDVDKLLGLAQENLAIITQVQQKTLPELRELTDQVLAKNPALIVVLASLDKDKASLFIKRGSQAKTRSIHAGELVKAVTQSCGGGGGGRDTMAQAGGIPAENVDKVLDVIQAKIFTA